jgi:hypothetical protein
MLASYILKLKDIYIKCQHIFKCCTVSRYSISNVIMWMHFNKWQCALANVAYSIILLCLMPDDFTRQGENAASKLVL